MGKITRRGVSLGAVALTGALAFSGTAFAGVTDPEPVDPDGPTWVTTGVNDPRIWRIADSDRVSTSIQAAKRLPNRWGNVAIIASSEVYADALAATPYADIVNAPILLSAPGENIDPRVMAYLKSANFDRVVLAGGTSVFGHAAEAELAAVSGVNEVWRANGANRYETAIKLADRALAAAHAEKAYDDVNVFLADGHNFPDALAAGAAAAANNGVVLLTVGATGLDKKTFEYITDNKFSFYDHNSTIAVGGPAAAAAAKGWAGNESDTIEVDDAVIGADRYETAVMLAESYVSEGRNAAVASGENFPDGVVAGAFASNVDGPLLLTKEGSLTKVTKKYFEDNRNKYNGLGHVRGNIFVFGGVNSVSNLVTDQLAKISWTY